MKLINLLPKDNQQEIHLDYISSRLIVFCVWAIISMLLFFGLIFAAKIYLNKNIADIESQISQNQAVLNSQDYKDIQNQVQELNNAITELSNLKNQHYYWSKALSELSQVIPGGVQLNQMTVERSGKVYISGQAKERQSVIDIWSDIIKSGYFNNINFPLANLEKAKIVDFNYTFYVNKDKIK